MVSGNIELHRDKYSSDILSHHRVRQSGRALDTYPLTHRNGREVWSKWNRME